MENLNHQTEHQHEHVHQGNVKIYIDRKEKESPAHTSGENLYSLGGVDYTKYDLWKEEQGKEDDVPIEYNKNPLKLKEWEHFYSAQKSLNPGNGAEH